MAILSGHRAGQSPAPRRQIDSSIDLPGLAETLLRRRWTIVACVLVFLVLAFVALKMIAPRYTATARILIDPREQHLLQNEVVQQGMGDNMALVDSQIEVIRSEAVLGRVVKQAHLAADPEFAPKDDGGRDPSEIALENLAKATEVTRPDNTYVLDIGVTTREPAKAARLANAVAAAYIADQASFEASTTRGVSSAIRDRLAELQKQLQESEQKVAAFKREHNILQPDGKLLSDSKLADLSTRQSQAIARVNETKTRLQVMENALRTRGFVGAAGTDPDSAATGTLRVQLAEAKRRLAELQHVFGPRHPRVTAAERDVAQAEKAIRADSERQVAAARDDYKAAVDTLNRINADLDAAKKASFSTNEELIQLGELEREAKSNKAVYDSFLVRAKQTAQQEGITARTARVIADAAVPDSPSFPPRLPLIAAAGLLGLFAGIILAILHDLIAGLPSGRPAPAPAVPEAAAAAAVSGLVLVTTLDESGKARQAALKLAHGSLSRGRSVIFLDLAEDAPASIPGLADIATGEVSVSDAVHISSTGLQTLYGGRRTALANASTEVICAVFETMSAEYDDVVVNIGELDAEHRLPVRVVAGLARHVVFVVQGERAGAREKQVIEALADNGAVSVSLVAAAPADDLDQVA